jgi:outer membrane protein assembly factor BamB
MRKSCLITALLLSCLLLIAGCSAAASGPATASALTPASTPMPTLAPSPTPTPAPVAHCPRLPAAQLGQAPAAPASLYVTTSDNALAALNASDGSQRWKEQAAAGDDVVTSVAVENNVVYVATQAGAISALNASNGALRWCVPAWQSVLAVDQDAIYVGGGNSGKIAALNVGDGTQRWQAQAEGGVLSLAVADGQLYVSSEGATSGDTCSAFSTSDGKEHWHFQTGNGVFTLPAVANGVAYVAEVPLGNSAGFLYALNASDGSQRWHWSPAEGGA